MATSSHRLSLALLHDAELKDLAMQQAPSNRSPSRAYALLGLWGAIFLVFFLAVIFAFVVGIPATLHIARRR
jgi:hypothetical protein